MRRRLQPNGKSNSNSRLFKFESILPRYESNQILLIKSGRSQTVAKLIFTSVTFFLTVLGLRIYLSNIDPSVIRISASEYANLTQFVPCISDVSNPLYVSKVKPFLKSYRKLTREPTFDSLPCSPPDKNMCFRGVYDGYNDFLKMARNLVPDYEAMRREPKDEVVNRIALLLESLIVHPETPLKSDFLWDKEASIIELSGRREKSYANENVKNDYTELHADYFESSNYVFTAVLYDEPSEDLIGGETALVNIKKTVEVTSNSENIDFGMKLRELRTVSKRLPLEEGSKTDIDTKDRLVQFTSGLMIEPKPGRLVLFSGGGENFHTPVGVQRGTRPTYHFWFKCNSNMQ